ncbi:hybrid sensor histidine kinase/response regulator [Paraburkholderia sacchari]|uniref:hybrid sensor histidine kinase/response regulator n=1 Tax=Paraburkholderia sacchari TaxID=159450 RepID=UPI001BCECF9F|nr:hybrid sensor histidine kinase/response regulator [Paraburkholderia sacchari]
MNDAQETNTRVAAWLRARRRQLTRHWMREVRKQIRIKPVSHEAVIGLIDQLPELFEELCAMLEQNGSPRTTAMRAASDARLHAHERWQQGFALDELYAELDVLHRCVQAYVRKYFLSVPSRQHQPATHATIEAFFSDAIRTGIAQFQSQADRRVSEAIGERDRALAGQHRSEERLRIATEAAGLGIFEWDPETDGAVWENERMYEITGQPTKLGPLSAREFTRILARPEDAARLGEALDAASAGHHEVHATFEICRLTTGERRHVEICARCLPDATGARQVVAGTLADITDRVLVEEKLKEADRRKDVFLATLAHELRNPLAPILNAASFLRRREISARQLRWLQGVVERQAKHLATLIDDLLDLSRISAGKIRLRREVFDIRTAIERAIEINAPAAARHGHRLEINGIAHGSPIYVRGDPTRLTQVLSNLLDNATKYTADGGHIRLSLDATDREVRVSVEDNGIGMEPSTIASMFEMFEQAAEDSTKGKSGLGIGLSVARSLVTMHGGTIQASSEGRDKGSTFVIALPVCHAPARIAVQAQPAGNGPPARLRVLIVDDNDDASASLAAVLEDHDVHTASCGEEALEMADRLEPQVVILDLGLPDVSGYEVAERISGRAGANGSLGPVLVALTGYGLPEDVERTRQVGFDHHIVKPARPEEIATLLEEIGKAASAREQ